MLSSNLLTRILETNRLIETNYKDWLKNLRIVLSSDKLTHVLDQKIPMLPTHSSPDQWAVFEKWMDDDDN